MKLYSEMGLKPEIFKAIDGMGFVNPTPIQEKTIPAILKGGNDIIALAQTGTGKTAAFGLPIIQQIEIGNRKTQSLILAPTRELCLQIASDLNKYAHFIKGLSVIPVYGGASIVPQLNSLRDGAQVVVGTPGRTLDLIKRKALKIENIRWMVLDEADEMLNMGFKEDLDSILSVTPPEKLTLLFSATMPTGVRHIAKNYMNNIEEIAVAKKNVGADNVQHQYFVIKASDRYLALKRLADINPNIYGIVFCRTRRETQEIAAKLIQDGYNADALHGDLSQAQRDQVMLRFRRQHLQLLIATDVAARGLDVNSLTHVINFQLPDDNEVYVHRSGRTGRAGKSGISITLVHARETRKIKEIEKLVGKKFSKELIPEGKVICEQRMLTLVDQIEKVVVDEEQIGSFLPSVIKKLEWLERDELIKRFVSVEFNQFLEYYKDAKDLNVLEGASRDRDRGDRDRGDRDRGDRDRGDRDRGDRDRGDRDGDSRRRGSSGFTRFYINLGGKDNLNAAHLIGLINDTTSTRDIEIGKIDILRKFSFFEVDKSHENLILDSFKDISYEEVKIEVQVSKPEAPARRDGQGGGQRRDGARSSSRSSDTTRKRRDSGSGSGERRDVKKPTKRRY
ncbi:MAG: DEAD/DEAH box helicase [Salinivirgaceae bacterium]|nr:DEAD/DEAH box helicase [Salinivirgaceae bacterium]